ncbi:GRAM domain-containing protein [Lentibacillus jeotgali]|uniref:GRAM domain-containing protein n=1 Tax=Lentibacillus jeotgali TaxID=558169 RepID=UPI0002627072|nr:GRAM domain-containing protein [Lentibacillus jeotgali]
MELTEGEQIKLDIGSNLKRGLEYVGGKLKITDKNLYFKPHSLNIQKSDLVIPIKDVKQIDKAKVMGVSPNAVNIKLDNDTCYKFVIGLPWANKRTEVINYIKVLMVK